MIKEDKLDLSAAWYRYVAFLKALFEGDDIHIKFDEDSKTVEIYVDSLDKVLALETMLPSAISFGNVIICIKIIPANIKTDTVSLMKILFKDSPIVDDIITIQPEGTSNAFTYILFKNEVVEYWNDNLGNPHGKSFTLYENIANEIFDEGHDGVYFTTSSKEK